MTEKMPYDDYNIHTPHAEPIYNAIHKLHNMTFMSTGDVAKTLGIHNGSSEYVELTRMYNVIVYREKKAIRITVPGKGKPPHKEWRFLADGEPWVCEPYEQHPREPRSKGKKTKQSTLEVASNTDLTLPKRTIDCIRDNAKKNGLAYEQQARQDLIDLYKDYIIEIDLTDKEREKIKALTTLWGKSEDDATAEVLSEREPIKDDKKKRGVPSIITDDVMMTYLKSLNKPKSTRQIFEDMKPMVNGLDNMDIVAAKLGVFNNKGYLKMTINMSTNSDGFLRKTAWWSLTEIGRQKLQEVA